MTTRAPAVLKRQQLMLKHCGNQSEVKRIEMFTLVRVRFSVYRHCSLQTLQKRWSKLRIIYNHRKNKTKMYVETLWQPV